MPKPAIRKKTKIIATIGPASSDKKTISSLIKKGVDVFRLNLSHGTIEEHSRTVKHIRKSAVKMNVTPAILVDLPGPKLRLGGLKQPVQLHSREIIVLTQKPSGNNEIPVPNKEVLKNLEKGSILYLKDGIIKLRVLSKQSNKVKCIVLNDGLLTSKAGINIPSITLPSKTKISKKHIDFINKNNLHLIAASFVEEASDITKIRKQIKGKVFIIAKIERKKGLKNIDHILKVSDGIMVARGDLGVELPIEKVALEQKKLIAKSNMAGKPVITATQMLESMVNNPRPTRAEVSDVSNAILDGTDCIMLSGETAVGKYPVRTVDYMVKIAKATEKNPHNAPCHITKHLTEDIHSSISVAACTLADQLNAKAIIAPTRTGTTARLISQNRPTPMIIAPTIDTHTQHQLVLSHGVYPLKVKEIKLFRNLLNLIVNKTKSQGILKKGDLIVATGGTPDSTAGTTNLIEVHRI